MKPGPRAHAHLLASRGRAGLSWLNVFLSFLSRCRLGATAKKSRVIYVYTMSNVLDKLPAADTWRCRPCLSCTGRDRRRTAFRVATKIVTFYCSKIHNNFMNNNKDLEITPRYMWNNLKLICKKDFNRHHTSMHTGTKHSFSRNNFNNTGTNIICVLSTNNNE